MEPLQWRHNGHDSVSNHQPHHCLLSCLFSCRSKKTSKVRVTVLCAGNSPVTSEFPAQMASDVENISIWWRHHECNYDGTGNMVATAATVILVTWHVVKSVQLIWRLGTRRWNLRVPNLHMNCRDLTLREGTNIVVPVMATRLTCPIVHHDNKTDLPCPFHYWLWLIHSSYGKYASGINKETDITDQIRRLTQTSFGNYHGENTMNNRFIPHLMTRGPSH